MSDSADPALWLQFADENVAAARTLLEVACLNPCLQNCHQAVEKALKAATMKRGLPVKRRRGVTGLNMPCHDGIVPPNAVNFRERRSAEVVEPELFRKARRRAASLPMVWLLISTKAKEATMFKTSVGDGVAAHTQYRHPLLSAMSALMAPLFQISPPDVAGGHR